MAKIIAAITAVLLAVTTYIAYKNQTAFKREIELRESEEAKLDRSRARLKDLQTKRDNTIEEREGVEADIVTKEGEEQGLQEGNSERKVLIAEKKEEIKNNQEKIAEIEQLAEELGVAGEVAEEIEALNSEIVGLEDEIVSKEAILANLLGEKSSTESVIGGYQAENTAISQKKSYFGSTRITAIYPAWGFVTIGAGNSAGVVAGSRLDVVRGGEVVASLQVRTVESGRASADMVPDDDAEDVVLMVGDRVVPSSSDTTTAAN